MKLTEDDIREIWMQVYLKTVEICKVDVESKDMFVIQALDTAREEADIVVNHLQSMKTT